MKTNYKLEKNVISPEKHPHSDYCMSELIEKMQFHWLEWCSLILKLKKFNFFMVANLSFYFMYPLFTSLTKRTKNPFILMTLLVIQL